MRGAVASKRCLSVPIAVMIIAICVLTLCACDRSYEVTTSNEYGVKYLGCKLDESEDTLYCYVYVTSSTEDLLPSKRATMRTVTRRDGVWYYKETIDITVDPSSISSAVAARVAQQDTDGNELEYNSLKVVLRYDTIYKSITSKADVSRSGNHYLHDLVLDEGADSATLTLNYRYADSAAWYSVLIAAAIAAMAVGVAIYSAVKGKLCQRTTTEK